jgi:hypothetical protein
VRAERHGPLAGDRHPEQRHPQDQVSGWRPSAGSST